MPLACQHVFLQGIYDLSCGRGYAFLTIAHSKVDVGTLAIIVDEARIVGTSSNVPISENNEVIKSPIIEECEESVAKLLSHDDEEEISAK